MSDPKLVAESKCLKLSKKWYIVLSKEVSVVKNTISIATEIPFKVRGTKKLDFLYGIKSLLIVTKWRELLILEL